jgi:hypothetical protein
MSDEGLTVTARQKSWGFRFEMSPNPIKSSSSPCTIKFQLPISFPFVVHMRLIATEIMILLAITSLALVTGKQVTMDPGINRIVEDMSVDQGYNVNLRRPEKFGKYMRRIYPAIS